MKVIDIGVACDGFTILVDDRHFWVSQEDDPSIKLKELFEYLGFKVTVSEDY